MNLMELHKSIVEKENKHIYIFTGEEIYIRDNYINKICEVFCNNEYMRFDTVESAFQTMRKSRIFGGCKAFLVSDDKLYVKQENVWQGLYNDVISTGNILILTYNSMDKRGKFYKQNKEYICEFEKLGSEMLYKYISRDTELNEDNINMLIQICDSNYNRIVLEEDKIIQLSQSLNISQDEAFKKLLESGGIYKEIGDITFKFTDSIMDNDLTLIHEYLIKSKLIKEPEILTLSVLYNNFRQLYQVCTVPQGTKDISKLLNLTPWQIKVARSRQLKYTSDFLIYILKMIQKVESGIKTGNIDSDIAIDYLLINIL